MPRVSSRVVEAEIDRLALWGVNLPLAFQGQEYTWNRFYRANISSEDSCRDTREYNHAIHCGRFNSGPLNGTEIGAFFSGPAFLPW